LEAKEIKRQLFEPQSTRHEKQDVHTYMLEILQLLISTLSASDPMLAETVSLY